MTLYNLVRMYTATTGTADIVVTTAVAGYKDCTDVPNGAAVTYSVFNIAAGAPTDSEIGHGTWNSATSTIARTTVLSSTNGNAKIVLTGTGQVALTLAAEDVTSHDAATVSDTTSLNLSITGQEISGAVNFGTGAGVAAEGNHAHAGIYEPADATIVKTGNASWVDLTDGGATTLHSHAAGGGDISGTGVVGQVAEFVTDTKTLQAAKIIGPAVNILTLTNTAAATLAINVAAAKTLTLTATDNFSLTVPATGTAALLGTANVFTALNNFKSTVGIRIEGTGTFTNTIDLIPGVASGFDNLIFQAVRTNTNIAFELHPSGTAVAGKLAVANNASATNYGAINLEVQSANGYLSRQGVGSGTAPTLLTIGASPSGGTDWPDILIRSARVTFGTTTTGSVHVYIENTANQYGIVLNGYSTQTNDMFLMRDSSSNVYNRINIPFTTGVLTETVFNDYGSALLDFRVESDTEANMLFLDSSADAIYFGGSTNGVKIAKGGDITLLGTAKYERHRVLRATTSGTPASQAADIDFFTVGGLQFSSSVDNYAYTEYEVPDDWDGTDIYFEVDWFPDSGAMSGTDTVEWIVEYRAIAEGEAVNNGTSVTLTVTDSADYSQYITKHTRFTLTYNHANQPLTVQDHIFFKVHRNTGVANDFSGTVTVPSFEIVYNSKGLSTN